MTPDSPGAYVSLLSFAPAVVQSQETWILLMVTGVPEVLVKGKDAVMPVSYTHLTLPTIA